MCVGEAKDFEHLSEEQRRIARGAEGLPGDPVLARLIELEQRIEKISRLTEELARLLEQYAVMTRAMLAGEAPPPLPRAN